MTPQKNAGKKRQVGREETTLESLHALFIASFVSSCRVVSLYCNSKIHSRRIEQERYANVLNEEVRTRTNYEGKGKLGKGRKGYTPASSVVGTHCLLRPFGYYYYYYCLLLSTRQRRRRRRCCYRCCCCCFVRGSREKKDFPLGCVFSVCRLPLPPPLPFVTKAKVGQHAGGDTAAVEGAEEEEELLLSLIQKNIHRPVRPVRPEERRKERSLRCQCGRSSMTRQWQ